MIELAGDLDLQFRVPRDRIVVDRQAAIGCDELAAIRQNKWVNLERTRFYAAGRRK